MPWLKRNLFLVVGGVVTLALLGVAGFFLYTKIQEDTEVTEQLTQTTEQLKSLVNRDPHPGTAKVNNIAAAKAENKKLNEFLAEVRGFFQAPSTNRPSNSRDFRELLDNTIRELQLEAEKSGVKTPDTNYWFTFNAQKSTVNFPDASLEPLTSQLVDITKICRVLYDAKVNTLVALKRVPFTTTDNTITSSQDYTGRKGTTNEWAVTVPYEVSFYSFSSEIATVLGGFIHSESCFIVKNIVVDQAPDSSQPDQSMGMYPGMRPPGTPGGMDPALMARYGMGNRYGGGRAMPMPTPQAPVAPAAQTRPGPNNWLEERMLRVTLMIDAVRLKSVPAKTAAKKP